MAARAFAFRVVFGAAGALALALAVAGLSDHRAAAQGVYFPARDTWERRSPSEVGMNEARLREAIEFAQGQDLEGLRNFSSQRASPGQLGPLPFDRAGVNGIVLRHGYIVAEFGDTSHADPSYSVAKSYVSTLLGLAIDRGLIKSVTDPVREYVTDGGYDSPHNAAITWEHHARQTSEWDGELFGKPATSRCTTGNGTGTLPLADPGTVFEYNDVRVNRFALSLLRIWKRPLPEVLRSEIMDPIGASDSWLYLGYDNSNVDVDGRTMTSVPGGTRWGGGLWMSTRDHARFGYLMLRNGNWNGRQIISESWIRQATTPGGPLGYRKYGYLWWLNQDGTWPDAPRSAFAALGDGPNVVWIDPEHDLVVVWRWFRGSDNEFIKRVLAAIDPPVPSLPSTRSGFNVPAEWPEVLSVGGTVKPPRALNPLSFALPVGGQARGDVVLNVLIAPDGTVHDASILRGVLPPDMALYEAAIEAMKKRIYEPTVIDGIAYPVLLKYGILLDKLGCAP